MPLIRIEPMYDERTDCYLLSVLHGSAWWFG